MDKIWVNGVYHYILEDEHIELDYLEALIKQCREAEATGTWKNLFFHHEPWSSYDGGGCNGWTIMGQRLETDYEYKIRTDFAAAQREKMEQIKKQQEDTERAQYEYLKAKFEGK